MKLHPASLLVGAGLLAGVIALSSAAPQTSLAGTPGVVHHDIAHPRNFVNIVEGQPFTVPAANRLVITNLGSSTNNDWGVSLVVNGVQEQYTYSEYLSRGDGHFVCQPGDTVEAVGGDAPPDDARAWGLLTDI